MTHSVTPTDRARGRLAWGAALLRQWVQRAPVSTALVFPLSLLYPVIHRALSGPTLPHPPRHSLLPEALLQVFTIGAEVVAAVLFVLACAAIVIGFLGWCERLIGSRGFTAALIAVCLCAGVIAAIGDVRGVPALTGTQTIAVFNPLFVAWPLAIWCIGIGVPRRPGGALAGITAAAVIAALYGAHPLDIVRLIEVGLALLAVFVARRFRAAVPRAALPPIPRLTHRRNLAAALTLVFLSGPLVATITTHPAGPFARAHTPGGVALPLMWGAIGLGAAIGIQRGLRVAWWWALAGVTQVMVNIAALQVIERIGATGGPWADAGGSGTGGSGTGGSGTGGAGGFGANDARSVGAHEVTHGWTVHVHHLSAAVGLLAIGAAVVIGLLYTRRAVAWGTAALSIAPRRPFPGSANVVVALWFLTGLLLLVPLVFFAHPVGAPDGILHLIVGYCSVVMVVTACYGGLDLKRLEAARAQPHPGQFGDYLRAHGGTALSWMGTWRGNSHALLAHGVVAYRVVYGVALTAAGPACARGDERALFGEFREYCQLRGWTPCLYSVDDSWREVARAAGWAAIPVAEEAYLPDPSAVRFTGKKFQDVRTALNRAERDGVEARWGRWADLPTAVRAELVALSASWVSEKELPEMGFTLGGIPEARSPEVLILYAIDAEQRIHGFMSWLPQFGPQGRCGWTVDIMRRRADGFRPVIEFLFATAILAAGQRGGEALSLSGAPLATVRAPGGAGAEGETGGNGGEPGAAGDTADTRDEVGPMLRWTLETLSESIEPVYGFQSLLKFKRKFQPEFRSLWLLVPSMSNLPLVGMAVGRSYLPHMSLAEGRTLLRSIIGRRGHGEDGKAAGKDAGVVAAR